MIIFFQNEMSNCRNVFLVLFLFFLFLCLSCSDVSTSTDDNIETGTVTDIDGNVYQTVKIGGQWWMAENLIVTRYRNDDTISHVTDNTNWSNLSAGAYCVYNNDDGNVTPYGLLYNWYAISDSSNIAPDGWHVPTDEENATLENYLISHGYNWDGTTGGNKIGKALASQSGWASSPYEGAVGNDTLTNNASGFTALPGGYRSNSDGEFRLMLTHGFWWSSSEYTSTRVLYCSLNYDDPDFFRPSSLKQDGFSVRCIKD